MNIPNMPSALKSLAAVIAAAVVSSAPAHAQNVIKIGEINSYKGLPSALDPYRKGMELAVDEINAAGGVDGKKLELVLRDDNINPADAVRLAEELITREKVDVLMGGYFSNAAVALADFAKQKKRFVLITAAMTDKIIWEGGNKYTFRMRPGVYMQTAMMIPAAVQLKKKRWAIVYPNYEYGQVSKDTFKQLLKAAQPNVEFVAEQAPPLGKIDAGSVVQALADAKPDAIFSSLLGADVTKFIREGNTRNLFQGREVVGLLTGLPEYLDTFKEETPNNWLVTAYPWSSINTPEHTVFLNAYQTKYKDHPRDSSVLGYSAIKSIAAGIRKAKSTDSEKLVEAFQSLEVETPFGKITYRAEDHQSNMGTYVGRTKNDGGKGVVVNHVYMPGDKFMPPADEVKKLRPKD